MLVTVNRCVVYFSVHTQLKIHVIQFSPHWVLDHIKNLHWKKIWRWDLILQGKNTNQNLYCHSRMFTWNLEIWHLVFESYFNQQHRILVSQVLAQKLRLKLGNHSIPANIQVKTYIWEIESKKSVSIYSIPQSVLRISLWVTTKAVA